MRPLLSSVPLVVIGMAILLGSCGKQPPAGAPQPPVAPALPPAGDDTPQLQARLNEERSRALLQGHEAMVACLHGERAQTDGNALRCEDWSYVRQNYLQRR
ncbi:hypothetical protein [Cyanobium sp. NIES-981]|uniref:hypothetical protein n=1 Tax=Cyanobium sp. NIES-981 TaxID=1851505 RepID=UPI0007DCBD30|nr:hypothetical protein [Cyanobium sp. NIES-981]SBO43589.1 conserved protein of unknown function [Cyanobium sp. NIES-981]